MRVDKTILCRYAELTVESESVHEQIEKVERRIERCERQIEQMQENGTVRDRVYGGEGGIQGFNIEGFPGTRFSDTLAKLRLNRQHLLDLRQQYADMEFNLLSLTDDILLFIKSIPDRDADIRAIARLRCIDGLSWMDVADRMGDSYTEDSVRKKFYRFMDKD